MLSSSCRCVLYSITTPCRSMDLRVMLAISDLNADISIALSFLVLIVVGFIGSVPDEHNNCLYRALCRHILLNKCDSHIAYSCHTTKTLNGNIDPTCLDICAQHNQMQNILLMLLPTMC